MGFSSKTYIQNLTPKFEALFEKTFKPIKTPMANDCHPELDDFPLISDDDASKFQSIIGSLNWLITLDRFDIHCATNTLSRLAMAPREGHLKIPSGSYPISRPSQKARRSYLEKILPRCQRRAAF